ncbi:MAG TPA: S-methyl-5-thioribose-1-phosphate isomerase [Pirellulales bacterium]|nr:S-methyl-5-thioribose-1-phosphate isomerase [Pirellulales bacterium]
MSSELKTLEWIGGVDGYLRLVDQTRLPTALVHLDCRDAETLFEAIRSLRVRGAPAIGVSAAYGVCIAMQSCSKADARAMAARLDEACDYLATSRPTAVNLFWALDRMRAVGHAAIAADPRSAPERLVAEAHAIHELDRQTSRNIGRHGAALLASEQGVLTHCNAGGLATSDYGTALGVFYAAQEQGKRLRVFVDETRPLLQGSRLTAWELQQRGFDVTLICDSMAAQVMREGRVQAVVVGADRIAANGDTANKIGTYGVAVLAAAHGIPFYVAAPASTFDRAIATGDEIPIEQRAAEEITHGFGRATAPIGVGVYNPAFDVTPARLIRAIICEHGVIEPVTAKNIASMLA